MSTEASGQLGALETGDLGESETHVSKTAMIWSIQICLVIEMYAKYHQTFIFKNLFGNNFKFIKIYKNQCKRTSMLLTHLLILLILESVGVPCPNSHTYTQSFNEPCTSWLFTPESSAVCFLWVETWNMTILNLENHRWKKEKYAVVHKEDTQSATPKQSLLHRLAWETQYYPFCCFSNVFTEVLFVFLIYVILCIN